jgi:invasion protein IalB
LKLEYTGKEKFKLLLPHEVKIENGTVIDTNDKELQEVLLAYGFKKQTK